MGLLEDAAARWASEDDASDADEAWHAHRAKKRAQQVADDFEGASDAAAAGEMTDEQALELCKSFWGILDVIAKKLGGPEYAQTPDEGELLITYSIPMAKKHVPADFEIGEIGDWLPVELVFLGVVAIVYVPKHEAAKERKAKKAKAQEEAAASGAKEVSGQVTARKIHAVP